MKDPENSLSFRYETGSRNFINLESGRNTFNQMSDFALINSIGTRTILHLIGA